MDRRSQRLKEVCTGKVHMASSPLFRHFLADDDGVPSLGVDPRSDRLAAASDGVCVLVFADYAVLNHLRGGRRHLAANRRRRSRLRRRNRLLLGRTTSQEQNPKQEEEDEPEFSHDD